MIRIYSEWDFGYGDTVFRNKQDALRTLKEDRNVAEVCTEMESTVEGLIAEGLIRFDELLFG